MTKGQEALLTNKLKQEGKVKGLMEKALDNFVADGLKKARMKEIGQDREPVRPLMGEHSRKVDI